MRRLICTLILTFAAAAAPTAQPGARYGTVEGVIRDVLAGEKGFKSRVLLIEEVSSPLGGQRYVSIHKYLTKILQITADRSEWGSGRDLTAGRRVRVRYQVLTRSHPPVYPPGVDATEIAILPDRDPTFWPDPPPSRPWPVRQQWPAVRSRLLQRTPADDRFTVLLEVLIGLDGRVRDAAIVLAGTPAQELQALAEVREWAFEPWIEEGRPARSSSLSRCECLRRADDRGLVSDSAGRSPG